MSNEIKHSIKEIGGNLQWFSLAIDESVDMTSTTQPAIFIRGVRHDFKVYKEFLGIASMKETTKRANILQDCSLALNLMG